MPEQLELDAVDWWVWRRSDATRRGVHKAVTRHEALHRVSERNGISIGELDAEVVREGDRVVRTGKAAA